jgi:hypothetical protein
MGLGQKLKKYKDEDSVRSKVHHHINHSHSLHSQSITTTFPILRFFQKPLNPTPNIKMRASTIFTTLFAAFVAAAPAPLEASTADIEIRQVLPSSTFPTLQY